MNLQSRRSLIKFFGAAACLALFQVVQRFQNQSCSVQFEYTASRPGDLDAYLKLICTPEMIAFRNFWQVKKNVIINSKRSSDGKKIISTHTFKNKEDLKHFWEAAKSVPGKSERALLGIDRKYVVFI